MGFALRIAAIAATNQIPSESTYAIIDWRYNGQTLSIRTNWYCEEDE